MRALSSTSGRRYNVAGELVESADGVPDGAAWLAPGHGGVLRAHFQRDELGRLTDKLCAKPDSARPQVSRSRFTYNINGQLVQARNAHARVELNYTADGLLARETTRTRGLYQSGSDWSARIAPRQ
ncbi:MAG TPA: hypothetical protein VLF18_03315 [Tahibacter sp.]|uniref:hypothetical protein n=1 Tax=Tahibacter sp. TaxID=2056211 RepID=UPI002CA68FDA|nr:hypothetical protein [Tahibacter sp.]HSX59209.1 hypothetical protein [Tahibacter sp.]